MKEKQLNALIEQVETIFMEKIPFNRLLGLHIDSLDQQTTRLRIEMREQLIGNFIQGTLHGGVICSVLDVTGGLTAFVDLLKKMDGVPTQDKLNRLSRFGTIDLRVDFLRPGRGEYFISEGMVLRTGNKVAVTRMELRNEKDTCIAAGTGTYVVV